jgi:P-type conjugative transfer protein TrbJ
VLTAARSLQQINNQIQSLQNEATMITNMARNLSHLNVSSLGAITSDLHQIGTLMNQAQGIGFQVATADTLFQQHFAAITGTSATIPQIASNAQTRWQDAMSGFRQTIQVQSQIVQTVQSDSTKLQQLVTASQGAEGNLQVQQAGNQLASLAIKQQMQLQSLMAAQYRADALEKARAAADEQAAQAAWSRFIGTGNAYTPQ